MTPPPVRDVTAYAEERRLPPSVTQTSAESLLDGKLGALSNSSRPLFLDGPLEADRVVLRRLTERDALALHRSAGDPEAMRYWYPGPDADLEQTARRIADIEEHWRRCGFGDWAVAGRLSGELIGFAGLHHIADMAEVNIGYVLEPRYWRRGLGSEVCRLVLDYGFKQLALPEVVAVIDPHNDASIGLVRKFGLRLRGRCAWQGQARVVYALTQADWEAQGERSSM